MTDRVTEAYLAAVASSGELARAMEQTAFPPAFAASCAHRLLPRPCFIPDREIRGFADELARLFDLLVSLPGRLFDGDLRRYCAALGISERKTALMTRLGGHTPPMHGRADLYHDGESFKVLEFNLGTQLGGTDRAEISRALLEVPAFRAFAEEHRLDYVHTGRVLAGLLREVAEPVARGEEPVVAFLEADGGLAPYRHLVDSFAEMMRGLGIDLRLGEVGQTRERGGKLYLDGAPIDVVLRYFSVDQLCEGSGGEEAAEPVFRAHEAGGTILYTPLESFLYGNKGTMAMLSDPRWREAFDADEAALIDRVLPWTRTLTRGLVEAEGASVDLLDYCRTRKDELILKPRGDFGGAGIVPGWEVSEQDWKERLHQCLDASYVVQRRVLPRAEPMYDPATGTRTDWAATWDAFITPHGYAGSHIRALPREQVGVVGMGANPACRTTGVFSFPE
ncbi:hypothetical protein ACFTUC_15885 [Streptomyces sp. NPDC056944]|uniref:hypothetical protein n=1 Tax=Streptomyces sp. NPDC056944 TaxID=3345972 RepID=UPI00363DB19C